MMTEVTMEAFDPGMGDKDFTVEVTLTEDEGLGLGIKDSNGVFLIFNKDGTKNYEIRLRDNSHITLVHEVVHAVLAQFRDCVNAPLSELLKDKSGEEVFAHSISTLYGEILENFKVDQRLIKEHL